MSLKSLISNPLKKVSQDLKENLELILLFIGTFIIVFSWNIFIQLSIIGLFFILLLLNQYRKHDEFSKKIMLGIIFLGLVLFILLIDSRLEIFLVYVGLLILCVKVFLTKFIPIEYKNKINYLIIEFALFYILIISQKIITILNFLQG
jgi:hypothetical protein